MEEMGCVYTDNEGRMVGREDSPDSITTRSANNSILVVHPELCCCCRCCRVTVCQQVQWNLQIQVIFCPSKENCQALSLLTVTDCHHPSPGSVEHAGNSDRL
jgi:hypothetical protein